MPLGLQDCVRDLIIIRDICREKPTADLARNSLTLLVIIKNRHLSPVVRERTSDSGAQPSRPSAH
jgi:hypothetical protein